MVAGPGAAVLCGRTYSSRLCLPWGAGEGKGHAGRAMPWHSSYVVLFFFFALSVLVSLMPVFCPFSLFLSHAY